jgi:phosphoenolpyruvate synthase/pyruvate phosphate dikinase
VRHSFPADNNCRNVDQKLLGTSCTYIIFQISIIEKAEDIFELQKGEIIICDAIGPEMTFAVPIAGGIVE